MSKIIKTIGKGGFGETFLVKDLLGREYVMKKSLRNKPEEIVRQYKNLDCLKLARSDYFVKPVFKDSTNTFFLMQYLKDYDTLSSVFHKKKLDKSEKINLGRQLIDSVRILHSVGFAHKDLKPANIMVDKVHLKLIDFGASCFMKECDKMNPSGTFIYMPPEMLNHFTFEKDRILSKKKFSFQDYKKYDLWALGLILLTMIKGTNPLLKKDAPTTRNFYKTLSWDQIESYNQEIQQFYNDPSLFLLTRPKIRKIPLMKTIG